MKRLLLTIIIACLLPACGPDRAQTIAPPTGQTSVPVDTAEAGSTETPAVDPVPTKTLPPADEPAGEEAVVDQEAILAALLTLDDMPTGWTGTAPEFELRTPGGTYSSFCVDIPSRSTATATVDFQKSALGPIFSHTIILYPSATDAEESFNDIFEAASNCPELIDEAGNTNTFSPLSFPALGDETFAMRSSGLIDIDIITILVDDAIISILHGGLGGADTVQTETFARAAVDRFNH